MCIPGENMQGGSVSGVELPELRGQHTEHLFELGGELALALVSHCPGTWARLSPDSSSRADAFSIRCCRMWAAMELPYSALNSSFMVEGFIRNRRDSCSMVMRLSRFSVSSWWTGG